MILSHSFHFVKCGYAVFSPFFCGFCHLSRPRKRRRGSHAKSGRETHAARTNVCFFRFPGARAGDHWSPAFFRARSSPVPSLQTRPAGDRILPRTPVARSLVVGATTRRPHVLPARLPRQTTCKRGRRRGASLGIRFQVDSLLPLHKIPCRFPACFGAAPAVAFSENFIFPKDPLLRFRRYSAARTMRSGYTLLVKSVDPSGQIMSRTYPFSPNATGISTVRVS